MTTTTRRTFLQAGLAAASLAVPFHGLRAQGGSTLRIGALNPVTGPGSPYGGSMQKAILLAADEINKAGGVGGKRVEVFAEDSQTSPEAGVLAAKKLIEINKVDAILGTWSSGVAAAVMPITDSAGIPHLTNAGASNIASSKGLMFRFSALTERVGRAQASMIADMGYKRLATMAFNNPSGRETVSGAKARWEELGNQIVEAVVYEPGRPSYRSEVQRILAANPDAIIVGGYLSDFSMIVREARLAGSKVQFFTSAWSVNKKLIDSLGKAATEGIMTHDYVAALDGEAFQRFAPIFKQATGSDPSDNYYACCAYDMMIVAALAFEDASRSGRSITESMRAVAGGSGTPVFEFSKAKAMLQQGEDIDYQGVSGPIEFDEKGNVKPLFKLSQVQNGEVKYLRRVFDNY